MGRAFNGHLADHHQFLFAHMCGRIDILDADIVRHRRAVEARLAPFTWETILDTGFLSPKTWAQRRPPLVLAQVEC